MANPGSARVLAAMLTLAGVWSAPAALADHADSHEVRLAFPTADLQQNGVYMYRNLAQLLGPITVGVVAKDDLGAPLSSGAGTFTVTYLGTQFPPANRVTQRDAFVVVDGGVVLQMLPRMPHPSSTDGVQGVFLPGLYQVDALVSAAGENATASARVWLGPAPAGPL